jgi:hypothetical protein
MPESSRQTRDGCGVKKKRRWVQKVQETSNAMDIPPGLFTRSPRAIARGLKSAVMESDRTKGTKFQSAMSMLNWFINRGGRGISRGTRARLEQAKPELRRLFGKPDSRRRRSTPDSGRVS